MAFELNNIKKPITNTSNENKLVDLRKKLRAKIACKQASRNNTIKPLKNQNQNQNQNDIRSNYNDMIDEMKSLTKIKSTHKQVSFIMQLLSNIDLANRDGIIDTLVHTFQQKGQKNIVKSLKTARRKLLADDSSM